MVKPPVSHRESPIFLNVLRVVELPEAVGLLAPRPLRIYGSSAKAFATTAAIYQVAGGELIRETAP